MPVPGRGQHSQFPIPSAQPQYRMFSQFRHAVETFVPPTRSSIDEDTGTTEERPTSSQLAESALSNLRRSFTTNSQRSASPASKSGASKKSTLEERLRAVAFTIGEASNGTTPDLSTRTSPSPSVSGTIVKDHPLSPTLTPLPDSRPTSPPTTTVAATHFTVAELSSLEPTAEDLEVATETLPKTKAEDELEEKAPTTEMPKTKAEDELEDKAPTETPISDVMLSTDIPALGNLEEEDITASSSLSPVDNAQRSVEEEAPKSPLPENNSIEESSLALAPTANDEELNTEHAPSSCTPTVEELQERLQLVERRFTDVSTSFKRLQSEKLAADVVLKEFTPLETFQDNGALREYLENMKLKVEISQEEIKRLNEKLERQEDRIEEMRDTHRLEAGSQSDQIENLRKQLAETHALLKASRGSAAQGEEQLVSQRAEVERLQKEVEKVKEATKEEEEKRIKAVSLLKTVRQKLVKTEKEKEDAVKELTTAREQNAAGKAKEDAEKAKLKSEIESVNAEREKAVSGLKIQFDRELALAKERHEKEFSAIKGQLELEMITMKNFHTKEFSQKASQMSDMEDRLQVFTRDKNTLFDQLQSRQAELESSQSRIDSLESENVELRHQVRELDDRLALVREELVEARKENERQSRKESGNSEEVAHMFSAMEVKYEAKISELKRVLSTLEKERTESDAEWIRKVREKNKEVEGLKGRLGSASRLKEQDEGVVNTLKTEIKRLRNELQSGVSSSAQNAAQNAALMEKMTENESVAKSRAAELETKVKHLEVVVAEAEAREAQLRSGNKTLREELRKVQSSVALLDRQRNPGVGYWTSRDTTASESRASISSSSSDGPSKDARSSSSSAAKNEEEVNLEYLRNVIFQFLEHKEMRPNLVKVLSVILHFTPQETRRLMAKV